MRHGARFVVKRYAPLIGRGDGPRRLSVAAYAYTLHEAWWQARRVLAHEGPAWVEAKGQPATRKGGA